MIANGTYTIVGVQSGKAVDNPGATKTSGTQQEIWTIIGGKTADGTLLDQWLSNGGTNQQWKFQ